MKAHALEANAGSAAHAQREGMPPAESVPGVKALKSPVSSEAEKDALRKTCKVGLIKLKRSSTVKR